MRLVVGLGNPGAKYEQTRHNIGFEVIDYLASGAGVGSFRSRFAGQIAEWRHETDTVLLIKPETFMNLSGQCVRQVIEFYKCSISDLLVVCDDIALPLGKLRARAKGSDGGQKGLRSIGEQLGSSDFARLRIGVGEPGEIDAAAFVLSRFKPGERSVVDEAIQAAGSAVQHWLRDGIEACMNRVNGGAEKPAKPKKASPTDRPTGDGGKPAGPK